MSRMHADEIHVDASLVRRLLRSQFPVWAGLPIRPVEPAGTDNAIFRLGEAMSVRVPRIAWAADQPLKEHTWLPRLAPHLSLAIPVPLGLGEPAHGYPWNWSVCTWVPGDPATPDRVGSAVQVAEDLARLISEIQAIEPRGGPSPDGRGGPLAPRDEACRASIAKLGDAIDGPRVEAEWQTALDAPVWSQPPVWIHGDLDARNLLATDGHLSGVIDFGALAVGDPAADVMVAWKMLDSDGRTHLRRVFPIDDATWLRARGWLLSQAVMILSYYTPETNPVLVLEAERWMTELSHDPL